MHDELYLDEDLDQFTFTYSVKMETNTVTEWAHRMDHYMQVGNKNEHAIGVLISLLVMFGLAGILACMLKRDIHKDFDNWVKNSITLQQKRQERVR